MVVKNIQNWWHEYTVDKDGNYDEFDNWEGEVNYHLCDKHTINDL